MLRAWEVHWRLGSRMCLPESYASVWGELHLGGELERGSINLFLIRASVTSSCLDFA